MSTVGLPAQLLSVSAAEIESFCRENHITYLGLFGSAVRGELRDDSDLDVLVEFDPNGHVGLMEYNRVQRQLGAILGRRVDLVSRRGLNQAIRDEVLASTVDVYAH